MFSRASIMIALSQNEKAMITIVDYGLGNLGSIGNMFKRIGVPSIVSSRAEDIEVAEKLVLPGVGAFDKGMRCLRESGLIEVLHQRVLRDRTPVLGICLGMQLLAIESEEGDLKGLGWVDASIERFDFESCHCNLKIPHMGWNSIEIQRESRLMQGLYEKNRFYFVHSYHLIPRDDDIILSNTRYGSRFVSSIAAGNILGVQFHPEKSHRFGMKMLTNFARAF